jgi:hypothetical protein
MPTNVRYDKIKIRHLSAKRQKRRASGGTPSEGESGWRSLVGEDFAVFEEALEFDCGGFGGVGGVDNVGHFVVAEVTADGAFGGGFGVGGAEEVADMGDDVFSAEEKMPFNLKTEMAEGESAAVIGPTRLPASRVASPCRCNRCESESLVKPSTTPSSSLSIPVSRFKPGIFFGTRGAF